MSNTPGAPATAPFGGPPPPDRLAVVTGASGGIGRAIVAALADRGWTIALVARNRGSLEALARSLPTRPGAAPAEVWPADLAQMSEVRRLARELLDRHPRIPVLINNAGAWFHTRQATPEGIERTWALNVLSPLLLTESLRPALRAARPARVVMVASAAHLGHSLDFGDLQASRHYRGFVQYGRSKLALIQVTHALSERYRSDGIAVNSLHPGFIRSGFGQNNAGAVGAGMWLLSRLAGRSPRSGARAPVWLATSPQAAGLTGEYVIGERPRRSSRASYDHEAETRLWHRCAEELGWATPPTPGEG